MIVTACSHPMCVHAAIVPRGMHADPPQCLLSEVAAAGFQCLAAVALLTQARAGARAKMPDSNSLLD
ncbi:hypothetical protein BCY88_34605 [Paraburkholderia fungorum]|uniref:Uncharacterized protein n=1 Tax=Paraburkholderia fungorum TaxID=134537 RepID=A0A420FXD1_9BURK|nr:hypothetical protein BCY88_34605 [Paraburkholderia fungorum]